jgi:hypothetical protein
MSREYDDIEIQEPPLKELSRARRRRFGSGACFGCSPGCLMLLLIFVGVFAAIFFLTTGPKDVKKIPEDFPSSIPIYKPPSIERIVYLSTKRKNRGLEFAAFFPKLFLFPVSKALDIQSKRKFSSFAPHIDLQTEVVSAKEFLTFMRAPIGPQFSTVGVVWKQLTAKPGFLLEFYKEELSRAGYAIDATRAAPEVSYFAFRSNAASGWVSVRSSNVEEYGTEELVLIVEYEQ